MNTRIYFIHALSPLHVGTGQGHGLIDLPIARDVATTHPLIPGSGVKGVLRAACRDRAATKEFALFGPDTSNAAAFPGALRFSDARLLLLPICCDRGTFAWITSPLVLARYLRDHHDVSSDDLPGSLPEVRAGELSVHSSTKLQDDDGNVHLSGLPLRAGVNDLGWITKLAQAVFPKNPMWCTLLRERIAIVSDDTFTWLGTTGTDVRAHIRIDPKTGTVATGALWYEESLPAETILYGMAQGVSTREIDGAAAIRALDTLVDEALQFGGNATTGMGRAQMILAGGAA